VDGAEVSIGFAPQDGPQTHFVYAPFDIVVYGGARGGGKTYATLGEWWIHAETYGHAARGLMIRRTREDLKDTKESAVEMFGNAAKWTEKGNMFRFASGAILYLAYLERDEDAQNYQGWSLTRLYVEEITQFPSQTPIMKLLATLRSKLGIRCQFRATCNPGGPGHHWVRSWVVDNGGYQPFTDPDTGLTRCFIPAKIADNPALLYGDPNYISRLKSAGSPELVRAWLEGDWNVIEGAYFPEFSLQRHVVPWFAPRPHWLRFRSADWGSAHPFSIDWWAVVPEDHPLGDGRVMPKGAIYQYRQWYGMVPGKPNVGLKLTAEEVAKGIVARELDDRGIREEVTYGVLDPGAFGVISGPSVGETLNSHGAYFRRAENSRVITASGPRRWGGWDQVRWRLKGDGDGRPMIYFAATCRDMIRQFPLAQHDPDKMEDLDTDVEDHSLDSCRYACLSRPWVPDLRPPEDLNPLLVKNAMLSILDD